MALQRSGSLYFSQGAALPETRAASQSVLIDGAGTLTQALLKEGFTRSELDRDWHSEFQQLLDMPVLSSEDKRTRDAGLRDFEDDFKGCALKVMQLIIRDHDSNVAPSARILKVPASSPTANGNTSNAIARWTVGRMHCTMLLRPSQAAAQLSVDGSVIDTEYQLIREAQCEIRNTEAAMLLAPRSLRAPYAAMMRLRGYVLQFTPVIPADPAGAVFSASLPAKQTPLRPKQLLEALCARMGVQPPAPGELRKGGVHMEIQHPRKDGPYRCVI